MNAKKLLRKREFWFSITVYPAVVAIYLYLNNNQSISVLANKIGSYYFIIFFIMSVFIVGYSAFEFIEKKLHHKVQGDKLKLKQEDGKWR